MILSNNSSKELTGATAMNELNFDGLTDAQMRLFAVRCARRFQHLMTDPRSIAALDVAERHAKGEATDDDLSAAKAASDAAANAAAKAAANAAANAAAKAAANAAANAASDVAWYAVWDAANAAAKAAANAASDVAWYAVWDAAWADEREAQQKILDKIKQEKPR